MVILIFLPLISISNRVRSNQVSHNNKIKLSGTNFPPFIIDDLGNGNYTWEEAEDEFWCSGDGTKGNPYIINNLDIDGTDASACIYIKNSDCYFEIINCWLYNSYSCGIIIKNARFGRIFLNNCSDNYCHGIFLEKSHNISIESNTAFNNQIGDGMRLLNATNCTITGNNLRYNHWSGILLFQSSYCTVSGNTVMYNYDGGISVRFRSNYNVVSSNTILNNLGNCLEEGSSCSGNTFTNNGACTVVNVYDPDIWGDDNNNENEDEPNAGYPNFDLIILIIVIVLAILGVCLIGGLFVKDDVILTDNRKKYYYAQKPEKIEQSKPVYFEELYEGVYEFSVSKNLAPHWLLVSIGDKKSGSFSKAIIPEDLKSLEFSKITFFYKGNRIILRGYD